MSDSEPTNEEDSGLEEIVTNLVGCTGEIVRLEKLLGYSPSVRMLDRLNAAKSDRAKADAALFDYCRRVQS